MYFMGRWERGGCKCGEQSVHLDICSLKEESYNELTNVGRNIESV